MPSIVSSTAARRAQEAQRCALTRVSMKRSPSNRCANRPSALDGASDVANKNKSRQKQRCGDTNLPISKHYIKLSTFSPSLHVHHQHALKNNTPPLRPQRWTFISRPLTGISARRFIDDGIDRIIYDGQRLYQPGITTVVTSYMTYGVQPKIGGPMSHPEFNRKPNS
uniref:Uncharacterized protein n=1 Tax=Oryza brachyantha TaxID=4533 RepID=J3LBV1_ORYBR